MRKTFIIDGELFEYDDAIQVSVINTALEDIPMVIFENKIQTFIKRFDFVISVFGSGDDEYGIFYECKVKQGFNSVIYEAPETSNRIDGILNCFEWLVNNQKIDNPEINDITQLVNNKCIHARKTRMSNGFYYCTDCSSQIKEILIRNSNEHKGN